MGGRRRGVGVGGGGGGEGETDSRSLFAGVGTSTPVVLPSPCTSRTSTVVRSPRVVLVSPVQITGGRTI